MRTETQQITFDILNSGSPEIDAAYFIKMMFEHFDLSDEQKFKVIEFVKPYAK